MNGRIDKRTEAERGRDIKARLLLWGAAVVSGGEREDLSTHTRARAAAADGEAI